MHHSEQKKFCHLLIKKENIVKMKKIDKVTIFDYKVKRSGSMHFVDNLLSNSEGIELGLLVLAQTGTGM